MATSFPNFVDVPEGEEPAEGTPLVNAAYLNSVNGAVNLSENALDAKANADDLATVATSGAYTDLIGQPAIPSTLAALDDVDVTGAAVGDVPAVVQASPLGFAARAGVADVVADRPTGIAATDTAMLLAAIAATPQGGKLWIPRGAAPEDRYVIDQALVIDRHISIEGVSVTETWNPRTQGGALNRPNEPYAMGSVIEQVGAGQDIIRVEGSAVVLHLRNLGLIFAEAIAGDTGHGITAATTLPGTDGGHDTGVMSFRWDNIIVGGHDGDHYAFHVLNSMYGTLTHLRAYGGGGMHIECDSHEGNFGNLTINHLYNELFNAGTADGVRLTARSVAPAVTGVLNLLTFLRPQVNVTGDAATQGTQKAWNSAGGAALPVGVDLISPDFEIPTGPNTIDFGGINSGTIARLGGHLDAVPTGGFDPGPGANHQRFTATGTFKTPNGVSKIRVRAAGGGGGGGGGGAALTTGGVTTQVGGGGGGAGLVCDGTVEVNPGEVYTVTVGAAGTSGAAGTVNGGVGGNGGTGGRSSFHSLVRADGGSGGQGGRANSTAASGGGIYARTNGFSLTEMQNIPGFGGNAQNPNGLTAVPMPPGVVGGGGGGSATASNGGGGGGAASLPFPAYAGQGGGQGGASGTSSGVAGNSAGASAFGCGGGGGGGAAPGGAGGAGGVGAPGAVDVWW